MKNMGRILSLVLVAAMLVLSLASCFAPPPEPDPNEELKGTYDLTIWVSEIEGVATLTQAQIDAFEEANPGIVINATVEGVSEGDAATQVINDVASAPDLFCFAQDQLARLVQAAALAPLGTNAAAAIRANNDSFSVSASTVAGTLYAYPLTSDNGYFLYYDTSVLTADDVKNVTTILAKADAAGKKFGFEVEGSAWYTASYFFGAGCVSDWTMDADGNYNAVNDDFNSAKGLIAMKGLQELTQHPAYINTSGAFDGTAAIVTGIWNANAAQQAYKENLGVAILPSYTVDGTDYQLGSFYGHKLMGVKPQTDAKKQAVCSLLAQYLSGEDCQMDRYEEFQWGPSNKNAQETDAVKANASLTALAQQNVHGKLQGQIHGSWWDIAKTLASEAKEATSVADLETALTEYKAAIDALFNMSEEEKAAWSVIGSICGTSWNTDFALTLVSENTYETAPLELTEGEEYKVRQGASWDVNFGLDGAPNGANMVVAESGTYKVQFVYDGTNAPTITLIPVTAE